MLSCIELDCFIVEVEFETATFEGAGAAATFEGAGAGTVVGDSRLAEADFPVK